MLLRVILNRLGRKSPQRSSIAVSDKLSHGNGTGREVLLVVTSTDNLQYCHSSSMVGLQGCKKCIQL